MPLLSLLGAKARDAGLLPSPFCLVTSAWNTSRVKAQGGRAYRVQHEEYPMMEVRRSAAHTLDSRLRTRRPSYHASRTRRQSPRMKDKGRQRK
eukprot:scaffold104403_cov31-Tisochrysis_lutea.AAC.1